MTVKSKELTRQTRGALHSLMKLKYLASRNRFKFALRPYDVRDVVESFGVGHAKLAGEVKDLKKTVERIEKSISAFVTRVEEDRRRKIAASSPPTID